MTIDKFLHPLPFRGAVTGTGLPGPPGPGFKLTADEKAFDMEQKHLTNIPTATRDETNHAANVHFVKSYVEQETGLELLQNGHVQAKKPLKLSAPIENLPEQAVSQSYVDQKISELPPAPTRSRGFTTETKNGAVVITAKGRLNLLDVEPEAETEAVNKKYVLENLGIQSKNDHLEASKPLRLKPLTSDSAQEEAVSKKYVDEKTLEEKRFREKGEEIKYLDMKKRVLRNVLDPRLGSDVVTKTYLSTQLSSMIVAGNAPAPGFTTQTKPDDELEITAQGRLFLHSDTPIEKNEAVSKEYVDTRPYLTVEKSKVGKHDIANVNNVIFRNVTRGVGLTDAVNLGQLNDRIMMHDDVDGSFYYDMKRRRITDIDYPRDINDAASKAYVDERILLDKDEILPPPTKKLRLSYDPSETTDAIPKKYVDDRIILKDNDIIVPSEGKRLRVEEETFHNKYDVINKYALWEKGPFKKSKRKIEEVDPNTGKQKEEEILSAQRLIVGRAANAKRMTDLFPYGQFLNESIGWNKRAARFEPFIAQTAGAKRIGKIAAAQYVDEVVTLKQVNDKINKVNEDIYRIGNSTVNLLIYTTQYAYKDEGNSEFYTFYNGSIEYHLPRMINKSGILDWNLYPDNCGDIYLDNVPIYTIKHETYELTSQAKFKIKINEEDPKDIVTMELVLVVNYPIIPSKAQAPQALEIPPPPEIPFDAPLVDEE